MLVLSRKPGEKIMIGESITITIVRIGPNTVRIGIEAPPDVNVAREEVYGLNKPATSYTEVELPLNVDANELIALTGVPLV